MESRPIILIVFAALSSTSGTVLPSLHAKEDISLLLQHPNNTSWWAHVGDRVYYTPPATMLDLSRNISNYYYALGSHDALTDEMKEHRVGGHGRWHLFHLPGGPSKLQTRRQVGDRRSSFSALLQLQNGIVLPSAFPEYPIPPAYEHPLSSAGQALERRAVESITAEGIMRFLTNITSLPDPNQKIHTRSYSNPNASRAIQQFLQKQFSSMGLSSCMQSFEGPSNQNLVNVIAFLPGKTTDSLTIGAHYDSRPFDGMAPGADDNGSGVAGMLAVAKALMEANVKPMVNLYFVGFAAEEVGLVGSSKFVQDLASSSLDIPKKCKIGNSFLQRNTNKPTHRAIVLDEVGWKSPAFAQRTVNLESYDSTKHIMDHLRHSSLQYNGDSLNVIHNNKPFGSDHMSFLQNDMPAVLTINGDDESYPGYHKSIDTIDRVTPELIQDITKMIAGATMRLAGLQG